jgi:hypothetical protein
MKNLIYLLENNLLMALLILSGCQARNDLATQLEGLERIESFGLRRVDTQTVPIQLQYKATFDVGNGVFFSNEFEGARMNGIARTNDTLITLLITPENTPFNEPWYAFKVWSFSQQNIYIKLTYQAGVFHLYYPKLSRDRKNWENLDSMDYQENLKKNAEGKVEPENVTFKVSVGPDTLFVAAQEIVTSDDVEKWIEKMTIYPYVRWQNIGESREGRPLHLLKVGESDDKRMIMVISRQHPPEVTGFMAMQSFVETICGNSEIASEFRKQYSTYVVPLVNPDGVANGHWRHNAGGIDLNRDWFDFNQPQPLVFTHGNGGDRRHWDDQFMSLSTKFQVIRYDVCGFGRSQAPDPDDTGSNNDDLKNLLNYLKLNKHTYADCQWAVGLRA